MPDAPLPIHPADMDSFTADTTIAQALSSGHALTPPDKLSAVHYLIAQMEDSGEPITRISAQTNLHPVRIKQIQALPEYRHYLDQLRKSRTTGVPEFSPKEHLNEAAHRAFATIRNIMETGQNDTVRLNAAKEVLDRVSPKVQRTENASVSFSFDGKHLKDVIELMMVPHGRSVTQFSSTEEMLDFLEKEEGNGIQPDA